MTYTLELAIHYLLILCCYFTPRLLKQTEKNKELGKCLSNCTQHVHSFVYIKTNTNKTTNILQSLKNTNWTLSSRTCNITLTSVIFQCYFDTWLMAFEIKVSYIVYYSYLVTERKDIKSN